MLPPAMAQAFPRPDGRPLVIGHRGACGYRPENTMASFELAAELGADWVELDVHLTRDGRLAVIHDPTLERTTDGHGLVKDHTLAELARLDAGAWFGPEYAGERIPTLDAVLAWARARGRGVDVEIKNGPVFYPGIEAAVVAAVEDAGMVEHVLVTSFDHRAVERVRRHRPRLRTGVLYSGRPKDPVGLARAVGAEVVLPHWAYVVADDVRRAHAAGLGYATWATSDPVVLDRLVRRGVDAVATDHPDVLVATMATNT
jgi:glycerophosphoryl diester phosphodiesterase